MGANSGNKCTASFGKLRRNSKDSAKIRPPTAMRRVDDGDAALCLSCRRPPGAGRKSMAEGQAGSQEHSNVQGMKGEMKRLRCEA